MIFLFWFVHEVFVLEFMETYLSHAEGMKKRIVDGTLSISLAFIFGGSGALLSSSIKLVANLKSFSSNGNYSLLVDQLVFSIEVVIGMVVFLVVAWFGF
jgi:hypothetical protein